MICFQKLTRKYEVKKLIHQKFEKINLKKKDICEINQFLFKVDRLQKNKLRMIERRSNGSSIIKILMFLSILASLRSFIIFYYLCINCFKIQGLYWCDKNYIWFVFSLFFVISGVVFYTSLKKPPKRQELIDDWYWKISRNELIGKLLLSIMAVMLYSYNNETKIELFSTFFFIFYLMAVAIILINPKLILSELLTGIGNGSIQVALWAGLVSFLGGKSLPTDNYILLVTMCSVFSTFLLQFLMTKTLKVNLVQYTCIMCIKPDKLIKSLKLHSQLISDEIESRIKALKLIKRLDNNEEYAFQIILLEELTKRHTSKIRTLLLTFLPILGYILGAANEPIIQELFTQPIKDFLCWAFGISCNISDSK